MKKRIWIKFRDTSCISITYEEKYENNKNVTWQGGREKNGQKIVTRYRIIYQLISNSGKFQRIYNQYAARLIILRKFLPDIQSRHGSLPSFYNFPVGREECTRKSNCLEETECDLNYILVKLFKSVSPMQTWIENHAFPHIVFHNELIIACGTPIKKSQN